MRFRIVTQAIIWTAVVLGPATGRAWAQAAADQGTVLTAHARTETWTVRAWSAARRDDWPGLLAALEQGATADASLGESLNLLKANLDRREAQRAAQIARLGAQLDRVLNEKDDFSLSVALKLAVELHMLSRDKGAVLTDERIRSLIRDAEAAAQAAESRGDWLNARELYWRLSVLLEEEGRYRDEERRESQRLAMIRTYAPQRFWELRNARRNAEIEWRRNHRDLAQAADDETPERTPGDAQARREAELRPLPPYNPMGDDFRQKLKDIDENMALTGLARAHQRHVDRVPMSRMLLGGLEGVRTLAATDDLLGVDVFAGLNSPAARAEFIRWLDEESARLQPPDTATGLADLYSLIHRLIERNDQTVRLPRYALMHEFVNGAMATLDEFSGMIWPDEVSRFERNTQGRFVGVGIQIEMDPLWNIRVVAPIEGTPAQRAGIRPGDLIRKVDGQSTEGFTLDQAVDVITGPPNTTVTLTIEREVEGTRRELDFVLTRQQINVPTVKGWRRAGPREDDWDWFIDPPARIGYVRLTGFNERTDRDFDRAIDQMKARGLTGLILDLRFNPGGLLDQAVAITGRFVDRASARSHGGVVVTTHTKDDVLVERQLLPRGRAKLVGVPVVVLLNEGSASASEIVAGALQDYAAVGEARVIVAGARSYGKGSVQQVLPLQRGGVQAYIKVTTQYYRLPGGRTIHRRPGDAAWGVEPDLHVDMLPKQTGEAFLLRQNADIPPAGTPGELASGDTTPNPDDLISRGLDLQVHAAVVLLKAQASAGRDPTLVEKPDARANN